MCDRFVELQYWTAAIENIFIEHTYDPNKRDQVLANLFGDERNLRVQALFADDEVTDTSPNCNAVSNPWSMDPSYNVKLPSNWTEENCADLICSVREEYEDMMKNYDLIDSPLAELIHKIIEMWSQLGADDPTDRFLNQIKQAQEFAGLEDPDKAAAEKLGEMIGNVLECLLEPDECPSYQHLNTSNMCT